MNPWDSLLRGSWTVVATAILLGLVWQFNPASRTQFPRRYPLRSILLAALGSGVLSSLAYGSVMYLAGMGSAWGATFYGVGVGVSVVLGGILFRWIGQRGA